MAEKATKSVLRPAEASGRPGRSPLVGPEAGLLAVLEAYERLGFAAADRTWAAFSAAYDWTYPVERTLPVPDAAGNLPEARPAEAGWMVSGRWELTHPARPYQRWLTLPVLPAADSAVRGAAPSAEHLFAVPAETLWRYGAQGRTAGGFTVEIRDFYVPAGLARSGVRPEDRAVGAEFVGVGVAAMALGATRRLAAYVGESWAEEEAELAALLTIVREALRQVLVAPASASGPDDPVAAASWRRDLAISLKRVEAVARHAVAVAYGASSQDLAGRPQGEPSELLATWSAPLLQNLRYSADLLPDEGRPDADTQSDPDTRENSWT